MAWSAEDAQARARSVPPGIWARDLLVARRAEAGSRDSEGILFKLTSCRAEVGGTLDRGEAENSGRASFRRRVGDNA